MNVIIVFTLGNYFKRKLQDEASIYLVLYVNKSLIASKNRDEIKEVYGF